MYTYDAETLFVHQFMASEADVEQTHITQTTNYPSDGALKLTITGDDFKKIAVRIPGWCKNFTASAAYTLQDGYAYFDTASEICINFEMEVVLYEANNAVQNNAGRVAVARGPVVYCLEEVDNGEHLRSIKLDADALFEAEYSEEYHVPVLLTEGYRKKESSGLYKRYTADYEKTSLRFIPYFAFANRGESGMIVWVDVK